MNHSYQFLAALFVVLIWWPLNLHADPVNSEDRPLVLAVHPYLNAQELIQRFTPLAEYLSMKVERKVVVRVGRTYEEHIHQIGIDMVDIAYMGPAPYVLMVKAYGQKPLLAKLQLNGGYQYASVIITRQDSAIRSLDDLKGKTFAFGDKNSTMSHLVPHYMLLQRGVGEGELAHMQHLNSHRNVAHAVLSGDFDAGAVKSEVFKEFSGQALRILAKTPEYPTHTFVTRSNLPNPLVEKLRFAMQSLSEAQGGDEIMRSAHSKLVGLVPVKDQDYEIMREALESLDRAGVFVYR